MDVLQQLNEILRTMPAWAIRLILAATTLIIFYVLRRYLLRFVENRIRAFFHRFASDNLDAIVEALLLPVRFLVIAAALALSLQILTPDELTNQIVDNLIRSLVLVAAFVSIFRMVDIFSLNEHRVQDIIGFRVEERLLPILRTIIKLSLFAVAVIIVMQEWSIDVSGLLASLGIVGLAFSLAAQDTVSNLFGFSTIIGDRPFLVGEFISSGDIEGVVENVGVRSTRIRKADRGIITVPNNILATSPVERFMHRRIQFTLGVTYETTAEQMEDLLERLREMLQAREHVIKSSVAVYFTNFGDSSLDILILCDITLRDWRKVLEEREQVNLAVMRIVAELGLGIAFPTRSIYIDGIPENWRQDT